MRRGAVFVAAGLSGLVACGGGGGGGGAASCSPTTTASLSITSTGLSPQNVCVLPDGTVTFTNSDTAPHDIEFDTAGCPAAVGTIAPGAQASAKFPTQMNCGFHDANNASSAAFKGTVAVTTATVTGGY